MADKYSNPQTSGGEVNLKNWLILFLFISISIGECVKAQTTSDSLLVKVDSQKLQTVINSYKGEKAVLVNVWATWCIPCVEEFPAIVKIQKKYPKRLQVIFVSLDFKNDRERVISFLKQHNVNWTTYWSIDLSANFIESLSSEWTGAVPFTKIIDTQGKVIASWENKADFAIFNMNVKRAIN